MLRDWRNKQQSLPFSLNYRRTFVCIKCNRKGFISACIYSYGMSVCFPNLILHQRAWDEMLVWWSLFSCRTKIVYLIRLKSVICQPISKRTWWINFTCRSSINHWAFKRLLLMNKPKSLFFSNLSVVQEIDGQNTMLVVHLLLFFFRKVFHSYFDCLL